MDTVVTDGHMVATSHPTTRTCGRIVAPCDARPSPLLRSTIVRIDALDCWTTPVLPGDSARPDDWAKRLFGRPTVLLRLRDALVGPLGLTATAVVRDARTGFSLIARSDAETIVGVDDRHLDFRVCLAVRDRRLHVTTVVQVHNRTGTLYWSLVRRVHPVVVRRLISRVPRATDSAGGHGRRPGVDQTEHDGR